MYVVQHSTNTKKNPKKSHTSKVGRNNSKPGVFTGNGNAEVDTR